MKKLQTNWITIVIELTTVIAAIQLNGTLQVTHEKNLIWAQRDEKSKISRLVGVSGNPDHWIPTRVASSRYITAPGHSWKFVALTFNYRQKQVFWSDAGNNRIQGFYLNGSTQPYDIYKGTSNRVEGLAVDWLRGTLYWCDAVYNWIGMVGTSPGDVGNRRHRILIDTGLDEPHDIEVDPIKRKLFWSDTGVVAKIETSDLAGLNRKILVFTSLSQPTGLTYDVKSQTLYWIDRGLHRVESIEWDGRNRRILNEDVELNFKAITTYGDYMFLTEQNQKQLLIYKRSSGQREISFSMEEAMPYDVIMYDLAKQPDSKVNCTPATCDHLCTESGSGEVLCLCAEGYRLDETDDRTCTAEQTLEPPQIIYSIGAAVCRFPANIPDIAIETISLDKYCILTGKNTTALTFSVQERALYLYDTFTQTISKARLLYEETETVHILRNVGHLGCLAFDWVALNLYWVDDVNDRIIVSDHGGNSLVTLIEGLDSPKALAVDPVNRKLYWSVTGISPKIESSRLDGSQRKDVITEDLVYPSQITVDFVSYRLYWCDAQLGKIEWSSFDGTIRQTISSQLRSHFSGLAVFQDFVLWTETGANNGLHISYKDTGQKIRGVIHPNVGQAGPVITYDKSSQPMGTVNPCEENHCQHVCIPMDDLAYKCQCGIGYTLDHTGLTCKTEPFQTNFLVFSEHFHHAIYQLSLDTHQVREVPIANVGHPHAVTFDPFQQRLYWTDRTFKVIKTGKLDGTEEKVFAVLNKGSVPDGIAVASKSRLIYYTDGGSPLLGVMDMSGKYHVTLISHRLNKPRAVAVFEERGLLFWTDWGKRSRIERADMAGGSRKQIVSTGTGAWPNGITVDKAAGRVYWCDARQHLIESCDLDGRHRRVLARIPQSHLYAVTLMDNQLYYADWKKRTVMQMQVTGQKATIQKVGPADFSKINGIYSYRRSPTTYTDTTSCERRTQPCSHLCIPVATRAVCKCPDGSQMSADGFKCRTDKWLTNSAPFIIPTPNAPDEDIWSHVTTKPSLLNKSRINNRQQKLRHITATPSNSNNNVKDRQTNEAATYKVKLARSGVEPKSTLEENVSITSQSVHDTDIIKMQEVSFDKNIEYIEESDKDQTTSISETNNMDFTTESHFKSEKTIGDNDKDMLPNDRLYAMERSPVTESPGKILESPNSGTVSVRNHSDNNKFETHDPTKDIVSVHKLNGTKTTVEFLDDTIDKNNIAGMLENVSVYRLSQNTDVITTVSSETTTQSPPLVISTVQSSTLSNAQGESLHEKPHKKQSDRDRNNIPIVIAINNTNQIFNIKTIIKSDGDSETGTTKDLPVTENLPSSTTPYNSDVDGSPIFSGTTKRELLGLLLTVSVAAILVCASLTCCVLCYNKVLKKKRVSTDANNRQQQNELSRSYTGDRFELATTDKGLKPSHKPRKAPSNLYTIPKINNTNTTARIATIRIKTSGREKHYSQQSKSFATEVTKKYAAMSDSQFTGNSDFGNQPHNNVDNYSYQPDSGSDFSFETDIESNNVPDFVTFKYGHDSHV